MTAASRELSLTTTIAATLLLLASINLAVLPLLDAQTGDNGALGGDAIDSSASTSDDSTSDDSTSDDSTSDEPAGRPAADQTGEQVSRAPGAKLADAPGRPAAEVGATYVSEPPRTQRYHFSATLDYEGSTLAVTQTLEWTNSTGASVDGIDLSVIPAHVDAFSLTGPVTVDGITADAKFVHYDTNLHVPFPRPLAPGSAATIVIPFRLSVAANDGPLGGRLARWDGIMQFGEWFPIWSTVHGFHAVGEPQVSWNADSITLDLTSLTPLGIDAVAASGTLQPGATASHWVFVAENVRDFAFSVAPDYRLETASTTCADDEIELRIYAKRGSEEAFVEQSLHALDAFNDWFGCYGYPTFTLAEAGSPDFSMEFPTLVFIGAGDLDSASVVYHEVAHQWWYGIVGNDQLNEPWLDEAFAQYSMRLLDGKPVRTCGEPRPVDTPIFDFKAWGNCSYVATVYNRGAAFLEALHNRMGDEDFFAALKQLVVEYRHGVASGQGVLAAFQAQSSKDLSDIYREFGLTPVP